MIVNEIITELGREEKAKTANNIFMRFGVKKPIAAAGGSDEPYLVGYAGFVPKASDLKFADAKWKFYNLKSKEDLVNAIKKMLADKTFTAAGGVTISVDTPSLANRFSHLGEFLGWVERASNGKVKVEYKEKEKTDKVDNKVTVKGKKKAADASWGSADARVEPAAKKVTRHFTVTSPRLMGILRKNDRVMQYFKPNENEFVMGPKDFQAFVNAFGRDDIKITKKFSEDISIEEQPNQNWADKDISHSREQERVAKQKEKTMKAKNAASKQFVKSSQLHAKRAKADHDIMKARRGEPIDETTSAGAVGAVVMPIGGVIKRSYTAKKKKSNNKKA